MQVDEQGGRTKLACKQHQIWLHFTTNPHQIVRVDIHTNFYHVKLKKQPQREKKTRRKKQTVFWGVFRVICLQCIW